MNKAIVYVCGEDFFGPSLVSCLSFCSEYYDDVDKYIFICSNNDDFIEKTSQYCIKKGIYVQILKMDISIANDFPLLGHLQPAAYGRLFLEGYLDRSYQRVLYVDGDTLSGPVDIDFDVCLGGKIFGAVQDIGVVANRTAAALLQNPLEKNVKYFNAGVLLIDWHQWCDERVGARCIEYVNSGVDLPYGDQCAINNVCADSWTELPASWNIQTEMLSESELVETSMILHFTGRIKPWHSDLWKHDIEFSKHYEKALKEIPFDTLFRSSTVKSFFKRGFRAVVKSAGLKKKENWGEWVLKQCEKDGPSGHSRADNIRD